MNECGSKQGVSRRTFLKSSIVPFVNKDISPSFVPESKKSTTRVNQYDIDRFQGYLFSTLYVYPASPTSSYSFWTIPVEVASCAVSYFTNYHEETIWAPTIRSSQFSVEWNDSKYESMKEVDAENDGTHIGGLQGYSDDYDYKDLAEDTMKDLLEFLFDLTKIGSLYSLAEILDNFGDNIHELNDATDEWTVSFDWKKSKIQDYTDAEKLTPSELEQVNYWNKVDVQLRPDDDLTLIIRDRTSARHELSNIFPVLNIAAPSYAPSAVSRMSRLERERRGIESYLGNRIQQNPGIIGLAPDDVDTLEPDDQIFTAPVTVTFGEFSTSCPDDFPISEC